MSATEIQVRNIEGMVMHGRKDVYLRVDKNAQNKRELVLSASVYDDGRVEFSVNGNAEEFFNIVRYTTPSIVSAAEVFNYNLGAFLRPTVDEESQS